MKDSYLKPNVERVKHDLESMQTFIDSSQPGWTRRAFSPKYDEARLWLGKQMESIGLTVSVDAAANLIGRRQGLNSNLAPIVIGSHSDTVQGGGRFDGIIGVLGAIEVVRVFQEQGLEMQHPLEIVDFTAEEPTDYGISTVGSKGMVGNLTKEMLSLSDGKGLSLQDALLRMGGRPHNLAESAREAGSVALYLELHIEQGPVLYETGNSLGVVTGVVGIHRFQVTVIGRPDHAGTTPMGNRYDAFCGASAVALALEAVCSGKHDHPAVGTIGAIHVEPNGANIVPGRVILNGEIRTISESLADTLTLKFITICEEIAKERMLDIQVELLSRSKPIVINKEILQLVQHSCEMVTTKVLQLPSGAGHDANQMATIAPVGMIFVPSKNGRSHSPDEWTDIADIALGVEALTRAVLCFDGRG